MNPNGPMLPGRVEILKTPPWMLIQEGDVASKYATSPALLIWKSEVTTVDITRDGTNVPPALGLGSGASKDHARPRFTAEFNHAKYTQDAD